MMKTEPSVTVLSDNSKIWEQDFDLFKAKVYIPETKLPQDVINFGYSAPYLLYLEDTPLSIAEAKTTSDSTGLSEVASKFATSVVFISPKTGNWNSCNEQLFLEIISNSKIHQYYKDGYAILNNRFTNTCDGYAIRGAIFRTILIGKNSAADYIATKLMKKLTGDGLWGPADVCPTLCVLENLSGKAKILRRDIPVVSVNNDISIESDLKEKSDYFYNTEALNFKTIYSDFAHKFLRWGWDGELQFEPDFTELDMVEEPDFAEVPVSKDNNGDDKDKTTHKIGYIAYYNKGLLENGPVPLVLCFHGGGDSAKHIAQVSRWYKVAHNHDFLLICVENHINSTATETIALLDILKQKYPVNSKRIYATGFSMGGCKTWDLYQEYPEVFAALAPMDATFDVGQNVYGQPAPCQINKDILVPIFYAGGEITPLPELPFQAQKCLDRVKYVFNVNKLSTKYDILLTQKDNWDNKIWGINGDKIQIIHDDERNSDLTLHHFKSTDGLFYTVFGSISGQGHECRYHTCEHAWNFMSQFIRDADGKIKFN